MAHKHLSGERGTMGAGPLFAILAIIFCAVFYRWMAHPQRYGAFEHWPLVAKAVGIGVPILLLVLAFRSSAGSGFVTYNPPPEKDPKRTPDKDDRP